MLKNKGIIFLGVITFVLILPIIFLSLDTKLRRDVYNKWLSGYQLYQYHTIGKHVHNRDFDSASKQILKYIEFSQKFSKGKNSLLQGIFSVTELISSKAYTQKEFNELEEVYLKINEVTEDIYKNHIWLARALSDDDLNKSIRHLNKALRLSNSSEEAYREIIRLFSKDKKITNLMSNYCTNYFRDLGGGTLKRESIPYDERKFFFGSSSIFAISVNDQKSKVYPKFISNLNESHSYDFILDNTIDLNQINISKNFYSGSKVSIKNLVLINKKKNSVKFSDITAQSFFSYILNQSNEEITFMNVNNKSDILKLNLNNTYNDIIRISFDLKLERLPLISELECKNINEN